uniref:Uncharacterized protein n=1 Tax=Alexandrium andersonii TaxID=327968 RepID=A0A7S2NC28_9DINO
MVMDQIGAEFARCEKALDEQLANAEPSKAEHESKVQAASDELEQATSKEQECSAALDVAKAAQKEAAAAKRAAAKAVREISPEFKQATAELERAESLLQEFRGGPLATYRELHDRTEVAAEPERKLEEDVSMTAGDMATDAKVEEGVPTAEAAVLEAKVLEAEAGHPTVAAAVEAGA